MALRFEQSQSMRLGQQMKLAPRVIQSMEILQMPIAQLEERIEQELENNATLDLVEREAPERPEAHADEHASENADDFARLDRFEAETPEAADNAYESTASREPMDFQSRSRSTGERDYKTDAMANAPARGGSLQEQLLRQWGVSEAEGDLRAHGETIIQALEEDGFLRTPLAELAERAGAAEPEMERALRVAQLLLDPPGVAARDHRECLLLQLDAAEEELAASGDPGRALGLPIARRLIEDHLDDLTKNRIPKIAADTGLTPDEIREGVQQMRRLSLAPARALVEDPPSAVTPDAVVEYDDENDRYVAYLNDRRLPQLAINRHYAMMSKDRAVEKRDRDFLKTNLSNAQWLIDAVEQRKHTLLRVIKVVLDAQRAFFDEGPEALRPLPMTQVAEQLGIHVATVSRAVADKWLETPRGVVPLRGFFSGGMQTDSGEEVSYDAIKAALREVVDAEDKEKPLSDEALVKALKQRGIEIARRTVAKYRGQLDIPTARMRRQY
ncbi:MAG: RNA polymerase factor sigma-54 [Planctomycetota bacterium]